MVTKNKFFTTPSTGAVITVLSRLSLSALIRGSNFIIIPSDLSTDNINKIIDVLYLDKISVKQRNLQREK